MSCCTWFWFFFNFLVNVTFLLFFCLKGIEYMDQMKGGVGQMLRLRSVFLRGCLWRWIPSCWAWDCSLDPSCLWGEAGNRSISGPPSPGRQRGRSALRLRPGGGWTWWWCGLTETQNDQRDSIHACWIWVCVWMNEVWFWLLLDLSLRNPPDSQDAGTSASSNYDIIFFFVTFPNRVGFHVSHAFTPSHTWNLTTKALWSGRPIAQNNQTNRRTNTLCRKFIWKQIPLGTQFSLTSKMGAN